MDRMYEVAGHERVVETQALTEPSIGVFRIIANEARLFLLGI